MAAAMQYESFYASRLCRWSELGVYAGWVGPADEEASRGPIVDASGGVTLLLSGEPHGDATPTVGAHEGLCAGDHEGLTVLDHYEQSAELFLTKVAGQCSGLLIDEHRGESLLFNDRFGLERLFTYEDDRTFLFSSEAKAILAAAPQTRGLDPEGLGQFLACGCTFGEVSLFRGVRVLPAATVVRFRKKTTPKARRYFDIATWESLEPLPEQEFLTRVGGVLDSVVKWHARTPPRVAVSLTGGLDSRMIMASLHAPDGAVPCYTFGSSSRETYDVSIARQVAERCGQRHEALVLGEEFIGRLPEFLERAVFISDGYLGLSGAGELYLNSLARGVAPIRITGNYGGELLRGVRAFKSSVPQGEFLLPEVAGRVGEAVRDFRRMSELRPLTFTLLRQAPAGYGRYAIERSQVTVRSPFLDDHLVEVLYRAPNSLVKSPEPSISLIERYRPDLLAIPTDRGLLGRGGRPSEVARRFVREALFKAEYWTGHGAPHTVAALTHHRPGLWVEQWFRGRHKFAHPRAWFRGALGEYAREALLGDGGTGLGAHFDMARVRQRLDEHMAGKRNYLTELDQLLTIALTYRLLGGNGPTGRRHGMEDSSHSLLMTPQQAAVE
jgi:asparagine synthase (glutamine-hydrolysing)